MGEHEQTISTGGTERQRYRVTASALHVREQPSVASPASWLIHHDDLVEEIGRSDNGYWIEVRAGEIRGWCSHKYLQRLVATEGEEFPWMPIALAELGQRELPGSGQNARILEYLRSTTLQAPLESADETPWCSAFANWCVERAGFEGTDSAWARSWLNWGIPLLRPRRGCVVVLARGDGSGHVGFWLDHTETQVSLLGGNQGNRVCVASFDRRRILGYRVPA